MAKRMNVGGFLSYNESGSRLTRRTKDGLRSTDLGRISVDEAQKKAWFNGVPLIVNGCIRTREA